MYNYIKKARQYSLNTVPFFLFFSASFLSFSFAHAQPVTGYWKGKIDRKNVEVKIIKNGDSLTGTSYYYESANSYRRYSIKGYFDNDNNVVWWDDQLIEEKKGKRILPAAGAIPYLSTADFNCPRGTKMYLNGTAALKEKQLQPRGPVDLQKYGSPFFHDEWDFVIDTYMVGGNDPDLIDSIGKLAFIKPIPVQETMIVEEPIKPTVKNVATQPNKTVYIPPVKKEPVKKATTEIIKEPVVKAPPVSIKEKFATRSKQILQEIPLSGDSIELRFYDNAEIDGDSISIFLNGQLLHEHIRLTEKAFVIKLAVTELQQSNELIMVAENLGSIPPNTSLMVAMVDGKRYEARLESTEQSSAGIRFTRKEP